MGEITSFRNAFAFLSNFYPARVTFEGLDFPSAENAYQAAKTNDLRKREMFRWCTPKEAKAWGKTVPLSPGFEDRKVEVMLSILRSKFSDPYLRTRLLDTGDATLIEGNWWYDTFWGCVKHRDGTWYGSNHLGVLLMDIRETLRVEKGTH